MILENISYSSKKIQTLLKEEFDNFAEINYLINTEVILTADNKLVFSESLHLSKNKQKIYRNFLNI